MKTKHQPMWTEQLSLLQKNLYSSKSKSSIFIQRKYSFVKSTIFIQKNIHFLKIQNIHSKKYSFEKKAVLARAMLWQRFVTYVNLKEYPQILSQIENEKTTFLRSNKVFEALPRSFGVYLVQFLEVSKRPPSLSKAAFSSLSQMIKI